MTIKEVLTIWGALCVAGLFGSASSFRYAHLMYRAVQRSMQTRPEDAELLPSTWQRQSEIGALFVFWALESLIGVGGMFDARPIDSLTPLGQILVGGLVGGLAILSWMTVSAYLFTSRQWRGHKAVSSE